MIKEAKYSLERYLGVLLWIEWETQTTVSLHNTVNEMQEHFELLKKYEECQAKYDKTRTTPNS